MSGDVLRSMPPAVSRWYEIGQDRITAFADVTEDLQFIHLDEERMAAQGGTMAHGFLTLSMLSAMSYQVIDGLSGIASSVNYGFDRIRFVSPVRVGQRVRGRFSIAGVDEAEDGAPWLDVHWDVEIEIEGADRPALAANWITRFYLAAP